MKKTSSLPQPEAHQTVRLDIDTKGAASSIFSIAPMLTGGSRKTLAFAEKHHKPVIHLANRGGQAPPQLELLHFLEANRIGVLNVAGPRASKEPEIAGFVRQVLDGALVSS